MKRKRNKLSCADLVAKEALRKLFLFPQSFVKDISFSRRGEAWPGIRFSRDSAICTLMSDGLQEKILAVPPQDFVRGPAQEN